MYKTPFLLCYLFLLFGCHKSELVIRNYKSKQISFVERLIAVAHGATNYSMGTELYLFEDSTFKQKTCGGIINGTFKVRGSKLILHTDTLYNSLKRSKSVVQLDSLKEVLQTYDILDGELVQYLDAKFKDSKGQVRRGKLIEILE